MIEARRISGTAAEALELVRAMEAELETTFPPGLPGPPPPTPEQLSPPRGAYVVLYDGGRSVAGGGVRELTADTGEIKRMYVLPEMRSKGLARRLLVELEDAARDLGYARVRLDTGDPQPHALALYRSAGYREIEDYNDNGYASYWGEKTL